jgi:hypothetical protein
LFVTGTAEGAPVGPSGYDQIDEEACIPLMGCERCENRESVKS